MGVALWMMEGVSSSFASPSSRMQQKQQAESQRAALQQKLEALKVEIHQTENAQGNAADALAKSESAISQANRNLRNLGIEQRQTQVKLSTLEEQYRVLEKKIEEEQQYLSRILREQYMTGSEARIKLLLSGENPNRIQRDLYYMGYISKAKIELITSLEMHLSAIEENRSAIEDAKLVLEEIALEEREQKNLLEKQKQVYSTQVSKLSHRLEVQRKEMGRLEKDDVRLSNLINRLSNLVLEQKKNSSKNKERKISERKTDSSKEVYAQDPSSLNADHAAFAQLKGQLRLPVRGDISLKFGAKRNEGPTSKGVFIRAAEGSEIKSIAKGRVIFADWLRGFGNLIIIDHGGQYLSVYGNNQSLFKHPGDIIKPGDVVASVGNSGGNDQFGLYFELRYQGQAFDPLKWMAAK